MAAVQLQALLEEAGNHVPFQSWFRPDLGTGSVLDTQMDDLLFRESMALLPLYDLLEL